jgi:hypothetical protein
MISLLLKHTQPLLRLFRPLCRMCPTAQHTNDNKRTTVKATHVINKKTRADIVTINTTLANIFLNALSSQVRASFLQWRLCKPIIFVDMFV